MTGRQGTPDGIFEYSRFFEPALQRPPGYGLSRKKLQFKQTSSSGSPPPTRAPSLRGRNRLRNLATALILLLNECLGGVSGTNVVGVVRDAQSGSLLPGATVMIEGTVWGASTDTRGRYLIRQVPPGTYTLRASYIGYKSGSRSLSFGDGTETATEDFNLHPTVLEGESVVITAQATGQAEAINRQISAIGITNVVSSDRIQELPDANVAESVSRLPGVSIIRSSGEGTSVVIRGLQPKYNAVLFEGVRIASSSTDDRGSDLTMISPRMLEGIEVMKTQTADQDADVLGGSVNFTLRKAAGSDEGDGGPHATISAQGGYTGLSNAHDKYRNYKFAGSAEGRLFSDRLGVFGHADVERRNLSANRLGVSYEQQGVSTTDYSTRSVDLSDIPRDRQRVNGALVVDYRLPEGTISLVNLGTSGFTETQTRGEAFDIPQNIHYRTLNYSRGDLGLLTNILTADHRWGPFHAATTLSHTYSETKNPDDWEVGFMESSAGISHFTNVSNLDPRQIPPAATNDLSKTFMQWVWNVSRFSSERAVTGALDLDLQLSVSNGLTAVLKVGGKLRRQERRYDYEVWGGDATTALGSFIVAHLPELAPYVGVALIPITCFLDPDYSYGEFFDGEYSLTAPLRFSMCSEVAALVRENAAYIASINNIAYAHLDHSSTTYDYGGQEAAGALYAMATVNLGRWLTLIPGIRYQELRTSYTASQGIQSSISELLYYHYDTTVNRAHGAWLPSVLLRYRPATWCDVRLSFTSTLAYPDYVAIVPRIDVGSTSIAWNNSDLVPSHAMNFDAYLSFYGNTIGLLTVGGFMKRIDDLIYPWTFHVSGAEALRYFPPGIPAQGVPPASYRVTTSINDRHQVEDWGLELDWQTRFWYLPSPFSGLVLNVNFTHISSRAFYPFQYRYQTDFRGPIYVIDTSSTERLLYQPNNILNLSVGYDVGGFSVRVSLRYQDDTFTGPNFWPQLRSTTAATRRWDISARQFLPWFGLELYGDISNLTGVHDVSLIRAATNVPQADEMYGFTAQVGIRWHI